MKYILLITLGFFPIFTFAQHNCNGIAEELSLSIQTSITENNHSNYNKTREAGGITIQCGVKTGVIYYIDGIPTVGYSNSLYVYDVNRVYRRTIITGTYTEDKWKDKVGTPASDGNLEVNHLILATHDGIFRRSTPYGYYPLN